MPRISENLRTININEFNQTGNLFNDVEEFYLVIWSEEGTHFTKTKTPFKGIRLDQIDYVQHPNSFPPPAGQNKNVFPFITILALMLEAEKTPIEIDPNDWAREHDNPQILSTITYQVV